MSSVPQPGAPQAGPARLVVGDDGSAGAQTAWDWVAAQAWDGWAIDVVTVEPPDLQHPVDPQAAVPHPWRPRVPRTLPGAQDGPAVRHLHAVGDPRAVLLTLPADLLVVGRRGGGLLKALSLGSTGDWLLHGPPAPLVIAGEAREVRRVLVCADSSGHVATAVGAFARMPWAATTQVEVLSVADGHTDPAAAVESVRQILAGAGLSGAPAAGTGGSADPRSAIVEAARDVDLVVLGTRGTGLAGLRRVLRGSVAAYVAHHVQRPLLVAQQPSE